MKFSEVYYSNEHDNVTDFCSVHKKDKALTYFITNKNGYEIINNELIISDDYLNNIKNKLIKKSYNTPKKEELIEYKEYYIIYLDIDGYFVVNNKEDISSDDIELTPNEFAVKRLLE